MNPNELAELFARKKAERAAKAADEKSKLDAQKEAQQKRAEQGRAALRDVVVPYFQEVAATFPAGEFKFDPAEKQDAATGASLAVAFKIGDGAKHVIEVIQGNVRVYKEGPKISPGAGKAGKGRRALDIPGINTDFVFSGNAKPFIAGSSDLTREKLGELVRMAIEDEQQ
jgi:hypothetical protein